MFLAGMLKGSFRGWQRTKRNGGLFVVVLALLVFLGPNMADSADKPITLTLADSTAPIGLRGNGTQILAEEIEKQTQGRVKVNVYWGESLLKAEEILEGVNRGIADIGYINPNYYPKTMLMHGLFAMLPQGPVNFNNITTVYMQCFEEIPRFEEELKGLNQRTIYLNSVLPMSVVSAKPFASFEDFKGKKIRASSRWYLAQLEAAGAIPVSIPWGDCYMALQTGTIEGVYTNLDGIHRTKLFEPAPHVFTMKEIWIGVPYLYTINLSKWNKLPEDVRQQLLLAGKVAMERYGKLYEQEWDRIVSDLKEQGCIVTPASEVDIGKWVGMPVMEQLQRGWVEEAIGAGINDAEEIMKKAKAIVAEAILREKEAK